MSRRRKKAQAFSVNNLPSFTLRDGDDDDEDNTTVSQLESTIVEEGSPIRKHPGGVGRGARKRATTFRQLIATTRPPPVPVSATPKKKQFDSENQQQQCIQVDESQQVDENLASQISLVDTQQPCGSPISGRATLGTHVEELQEELNIESAGSTEQRELDISTLRLDEAGPSRVVGKLGGWKTVLESFKKFKMNYDSKVRRFGYDLKMGKYGDIESVNLVIREVMEGHDKDKTVTALAYDVTESNYKWIILKSPNTKDIKMGVCLKLYKPWQEISIEGNDEPMIVGADFYKILPGAELNLTKREISHILTLDLPRHCEARASEPLLMDLVPYHIKNDRTVQKQVFRGKSYVDVDIVVLNVWTYSGSTSPILCLIKDSDEFVTFLEIPKEFEDLASELFSSKYFKLTYVAVHKKIQISEKLAPFSVIRLFGAKQNFFISLKWERESQWEPVGQLDISMSSPRENSLSMDEIDMASTFLDVRVTLKCKLKEKECGHILVRDLDSDRSLMVEFVLESDFCLADVPLFMNGKIILKFLRLIHGRAVWDHYTTCEELDEEDST